MSGEEKSRLSRFRRRSRFKTPKAPPELTPKEEPAKEEPKKEEEKKKKKEKKAPSPVSNVLTVDVKEWFQTSAASEVVKFSHWSKYERRVEHGVKLTLGLLRRFNVKATFFILGIVAREFPELVRLILKEGHEIGTTGYYNRRLHTIPPKEYIKELEMAMVLLKSLAKRDITIHRAPEWSVTVHTLWVFEILKSFGIKYDSSIYPVGALLYGIEGAPRFPYTINPYEIVEFPPSTYPFAGKNISLFGGTYFRVLPISLISTAIKSLNKEGKPVLIHISPWEMDAEFPKLKLSWEGYLYQYAGVKSTFSKVATLLQNFKFDTLTKSLQENPPKESYHIKSLGKPQKDKKIGGIIMDKPKLE